jgi:hypothetical protein
MADTRTWTVEERLAEIGAGIDRLLDKTEHSDFINALREELQVWREWLDEVRLQASLGSMEERDRIGTASKKLERLHSELDQRVQAIDGSAEPFPGLRDAIQHELEKGQKELLSGSK